MLEHGTVKFFDNKKRFFGFLVLESGEELYFDPEGYMSLFADDNDRFNFYGRGEESNPRPRPGNIIYFEREFGQRGLRAGSWCFYWEYNQALKDLKMRPRYRAINLNGHDVVVWEGTNLDALKLQFPRQIIGKTQKPVLPLRFERLENNIWVPCEDPRGAKIMIKPNGWLKAVS